MELILYKNARVDMDILTEMFGSRWKRSHEVKDGVTYCTISVWDPELKEWISREDAGGDTNFEKEKGTASDSFKRAATNWGIGRELYTCKGIICQIEDNEVFTGRDGKERISTRFYVKSIETDITTKVVKHIVIVDGSNRIRFQA